MPTFLVYAGLVVAVVGFVSALIPLRFIGLRSRKAGLFVLFAGVALFMAGMMIPVHVTRIAAPAKPLDRYFPEYQSSETYAIRIHASPERVAAAIREVTPLEIHTFELLNRIRNPKSEGSKRRHELLQKRMVDLMHRAGFVTLEESDNGDLTLGVIGRFWGRGPAGGDRALYVKGAPNIGSSARILSGEEFVRFHRPGYAKAAIDFRIEDQGGGWSRLTTETRALGTDPTSRQDFERYWRVIAPGSAIIRREWLAAIRRRAEAEAD